MAKHGVPEQLRGITLSILLSYLSLRPCPCLAEGPSPLLVGCSCGKMIRVVMWVAGIPSSITLLEFGANLETFCEFMRTFVESQG
jgi:hypothetical protein